MDETLVHEPVLFSNICIYIDLMTVIMSTTTIIICWRFMYCYTLLGLSAICQHTLLWPILHANCVILIISLFSLQLLDFYPLDDGGRSFVENFSFIHLHRVHWSHCGWSGQSGVLHVYVMATRRQHWRTRQTALRRLPAVKTSDRWLQLLADAKSVSMKILNLLQTTLQRFKGHTGRRPTDFPAGQLVSLLDKHRMSCYMADARRRWSNRRDGFW